MYRGGEIVDQRHVRCAWQKGALQKTNDEWYNDSKIKILYSARNSNTNNFFHHSVFFVPFDEQRHCVNKSWISLINEGGFLSKLVHQATKKNDMLAKRPIPYMGGAILQYVNQNQKTCSVLQVVLYSEYLQKAQLASVFILNLQNYSKFRFSYGDICTLIDAYF